MQGVELKRAAGALDRIEQACASGLPAQELIETVAEQVGRVVPSDASFYAATDPETSLGMGAGIAVGFDDATCDPFWDHEFQVPDYNKFSDIARGPVKVVDLHAATGGRPERSARWREFRSRMGVDAEMRGAFTAGGRCWGIMQLNRSSGNAAFSEQELAFVAGVAPLVGRGVRVALVSQAAEQKAGRGPGMLILDEEHHVVSATPEAVAWLDEIRSWHVSPRGGVRLPIEVRFAAHSARIGAAQGATQGMAVRTRTRTVGGMWLLLHASCLTSADGSLGHTAVMIEPAKASDVAPLIVEAYELTPRELEVTRAVARGLSTAEVAAELFLSRYTVQDHLKRVYEKIGVATRGELVAKMFADHYHEGLDTAIHEQQLRVA